MNIDFDLEPYLAKVDFSEALLDRCCVKKATVTGVSSLQAVIVEIDGVEYENIPVWVHTDQGARTQFIKQEVLPTAADYFKNAALMFPFPEGVYTSEGLTLKPEVLVVTEINPDKSIKEVISVIGVLQSVLKTFPDPEDDEAFPTYNCYIYFKIRAEKYYSGLPPTYVGGMSYARELYFMYDMITDSVAEIPTYIDGEPALPFFVAENILPGETSKITNHISNSVSITIPSASVLSQINQGDVIGTSLFRYGSSRDIWNIDFYAPGGVGYGCLSDTGTWVYSYGTWQNGWTYEYFPADNSYLVTTPCSGGTALHSDSITWLNFYEYDSTTSIVFSLPKVSYRNLGREIGPTRNGGTTTYSNGFNVISRFSLDSSLTKKDRKRGGPPVYTNEIDFVASGQDNITINYTVPGKEETATFSFSASCSYQEESLTYDTSTCSLNITKHSDFFAMFVSPYDNYFFNNKHCGFSNISRSCNFSGAKNGYSEPISFTKGSESVTISEHNALSIIDNHAFIQNTGLFAYIGSKINAMIADDHIDTPFENVVYLVSFISMCFKPYDIRIALL